MHVLPVFLIVASLGAAPIEQRYPQAVEIYSCGFERGTDRNYDGWPDDWTRRRGPGYPHYLQIHIAQEASPEGQQCLRMALDGGAALAQSPAIEIEPAASYVLEAFVRTQSLVRDEAVVAIAFLDQNRQPLETVRLPGIRDAKDWRKVRLGPIATNHAAARYATIVLSVAPVDGEDLHGGAMFDDLWFARLPRMSIRTNRPYNLFQPEEAVEVFCQVSGFDEEQGHVMFELLDAREQSLAHHETALGKSGKQRSGPGRVAAENTGGDSPETPAISWRPPLEGPGFYRIRAAMRSGERQILERELSLAVIEPRTGAAGGEFGWSLSKGADPIPLPELAQLVSQVGISWVKFPLWLSEEELIKNEELVRFVERLGSQQIEIVGLLAQPPAKLRAQFGRKDLLTAADIFTPEPEVWYPSLEPVLTQLSMKVRWWQLGDRRRHELRRISAVEHADRAGQEATGPDRAGHAVGLWLDVDGGRHSRAPADVAICEHVGRSAADLDRPGDVPGPRSKRRSGALGHDRAAGPGRLQHGHAGRRPGAADCDRQEARRRADFRHAALQHAARFIE